MGFYITALQLRTIQGWLIQTLFLLWFVKTCMKIFSYRSSCVLHSEKRQQHVNSKQGECLTSLFIFWKKILSNILIKWESGYDIIWGQVRVQNNEKRKEVELKDMKNVWREEVKEEKSGNDAFCCHVLYL